MTDPNLYVPYNQKSVDKRAQNKLKLQEELGLPVNLDTPLYCYVGYMATHKGLDLLSGVLPKLVGEKGAQFVAIGKSTDECQRMMSELAATYPQNVKVIFAHDTNFVRKIYAGADFLFNVSSIEPCGLCPLIANRYGTLPIIYHTGGLKDNFTDFKYSNGNGYVLRNYDQNSLMDLIDRTLYDYENKEKIKGYILSGMNQDFDVKTCAEKYLKLYKEM